MSWKPERGKLEKLQRKQEHRAAGDGERTSSEAEQGRACRGTQLFSTCTDRQRTESLPVIQGARPAPNSGRRVRHLQKLRAMAMFGTAIVWG